MKLYVKYYSYYDDFSVLGVLDEEHMLMDKMSYAEATKEQLEKKKIEIEEEIKEKETEILPKLWKEFKELEKTGLQLYSIIKESKKVYPKSELKDSFGTYKKLLKEKDKIYYNHKTMEEKAEQLQKKLLKISNQTIEEAIEQKLTDDHIYYEEFELNSVFELEF